MKSHTRRAVVYIVGRAMGNDSSTSVYDYSVARHFPFGGDVNKGSVAIYDYTERCHVGGDLSSFYHHGNRGHISLELSGDSFSGYDYNERTHFSGTVIGTGVTVYDYGESAHFNYAV